MEKLAKQYEFDEMLQDLHRHKGQRFIYRLLKQHKSSIFPEGHAVLQAAGTLWEKSFAKRSSISSFEITVGKKKGKVASNLQCWDAGFLQIKKLVKKLDDAELNQLHENLKLAMHGLKCRLWDGIFSFGFLPKELGKIFADPSASRFSNVLESSRKSRKSKSNQSKSKKASSSQKDELTFAHGLFSPEQDSSIF